MSGGKKAFYKDFNEKALLGYLGLYTHLYRLVCIHFTRSDQALYMNLEEWEGVFKVYVNSSAEKQMTAPISDPFYAREATP